MQWASLIFISLLLSCCDSNSEQPEHSRQSTEPEPTEESPESIEPAAPTWRELGPINLIGRIPIGIRVSTTTPSGSRGPCLLGDGDLETAWNSASGDDHAWIRFGLPSTSIITAFEMTAGYSTDALFRANRRIRRISVFHNADHVGDFELDIESQGLQRLTFEPALQRGGSIEIRVEQFEPGTQSRWTEIAVSEVQLWGTAETISEAAAPTCTIGEIDQEVETPLRAFERLYREARHSLSREAQRSALLLAVDLTADCSPPQQLRQDLVEVLRLSPDDEGRLPEAYNVFAGEMTGVMRRCGLDVPFQERVLELIHLRDDYEPD